MSDPRRLLLSRRDLLKAGALTGVVAGVASLGPRLVGSVLQPAHALAADPPNLKLVGTDGWISLPATPSVFSSSLGVTVHPDSYAPDGKSTYIFGFANATGLADDVQFNLKNKAQHSAPLFWAKEGVDFRIQLTNVGLAQRPDLFDEHTVHWHGFKNVIPFFDGEPTGSVSIPQGQTFTYVYLSHDPGTYMFHCHVEDTEHVQMGMTGIVFVRPAQDGNTSLYPSGKYAYNDGDGSTGFDREFVDVPQRGVRRLPLGGRPHPAAGMERLPGGLQPAQRPGLPGHAAAERLDRPQRHVRRQPGPRRGLEPDRPGGAPGPRQPAAVVARHLQRRRAGPAPLREPRVHGGGA